jgi:hypothetical protein
MTFLVASIAGSSVSRRVGVPFSFRNWMYESSWMSPVVSVHFLAQRFGVLVAHACNSELAQTKLRTPSTVTSNTSRRVASSGARRHRRSLLQVAEMAIGAADLVQARFDLRHVRHGHAQGADTQAGACHAEQILALTGRQRRWSSVHVLVLTMRRASSHHPAAAPHAPGGALPRSWA